MSAILSISLSGMNAAQVRLQSAAHNIANLNTPDFRRQEITQSTLVEGGTRTEVVRAESVGENLEADLIQQLQARNSFAANLFAFKISSEMVGSLVDILA